MRRQLRGGRDVRVWDLHMRVVGLGATSLKTEHAVPPGSLGGLCAVVGARSRQTTESCHMWGGQQC